MKHWGMQQMTGLSLIRKSALSIKESGCSIVRWNLCIQTRHVRIWIGRFHVWRMGSAIMITRNGNGSLMTAYCLGSSIPISISSNFDILQKNEIELTFFVQIWCKDGDVEAAREKDSVCWRFFAERAMAVSSLPRWICYTTRGEIHEKRAYA